MAETNFLRNQFSHAALPEVYAPRHALLSSYYLAAEERFIYVGAQAGSGKTVSALLWLNDCARKTIWIGLDKYDSTPSVFYKQLASGFFSVQPDNIAMKAVLTSSAFSASPVEHTIQILSEMLPNKEQYALVIDDMHLIHNEEIFKSLPAVLRRLPHNFVTVILSRYDFPIAFKPLMRDSLVNSIGTEQLRFTKDEIREYFSCLGRFLTPNECDAAFIATEGWAIGVNAVSKSGEITKGYGYAFSKYFEEQVWDTWAQPLKDFCLATAVVDEFDPMLAKALSGREDAQDVLEELASTNSFLTHLRENTYRYHHLFQDFLRDKLTDLGIDSSELCKKTAHYYKEQGDYSRALRFWMDSGDFKGIDSFLFLFLFQNHRGAVADYADFLSTFFAKDFPKNAYKDSPVLHVLSAWYYYMTSRHEKFSLHMDAIIRNLPRIAKAGDEFVEFAILAFSVDHRKTFRKKIKLFSMFSWLLKKYTPEGLATNIASFTHNLPYMHRSNLDYSEITIDLKVLDAIDTTFARLLGSEWVYIRPGITACFSYEKNKLDEALSYNEQAISYATPEAKAEGKICMTVLQHSILWQMDKQEEAMQLMTELSALVESKAQFFIPNLKAYQAKLQLLNGDLSVAQEWLDEYFVVETVRIELFRVFQHFTTARAYIALHKFEDAQRYLEMLKQYGQNLNRPLDRSEAGVLLAAIYWAGGGKKEALAEMEAVLELTQDYGYIRIIADEGNAVLPILKRLLQKMNKEEYTGTLKRAYITEVTLAAHNFAEQHKGYFKNFNKGSLSGKIKPLKFSKQQKVVIDLLSQGYRNSEICTITGLKLCTIKTHTDLAYKKLGVTNALDAVLKARELDLL